MKIRQLTHVKRKKNELGNYIIIFSQNNGRAIPHSRNYKGNGYKL